MKKLPMIIAATLVACLAAGSLAIGAGRTDTVGSTLSAKYEPANPSDPYGTSSFKGKVGPKGCAKSRQVTISHYGKTKTDSKGNFSLTIPSPAQAGRYKVKVAEKETSGILCTKVKAVLKIK
jgi:hypothetical protein